MGPVLGLFSGASYTSETVQLSHDDLVVICSDGVTEASNVHGDEFGRARVAEVVAQCSDRKAETVLDHLVEAVRAFSQGVPQMDDMTVMVLRVNGFPARHPYNVVWPDVQCLQPWRQRSRRRRP